MKAERPASVTVPSLPMHRLLRHGVEAIRQLGCDGLIDANAKGAHAVSPILTNPAAPDQPAPMKKGLSIPRV